MAVEVMRVRGEDADAKETLTVPITFANFNLVTSVSASNNKDCKGWWWILIAIVVAVAVDFVVVGAVVGVVLILLLFVLVLVAAAVGLNYLI